jgi:hypothetical protein
MAKTHIPHAIIKTRKSQATAYCEPVADRYSTGFTIEKRNSWRSTQKDKQLTAQEQKELMQSLILYLTVVMEVILKLIPLKHGLKK